jgi:hypothetical protein
MPPLRRGDAGQGEDSEREVLVRARVLQEVRSRPSSSGNPPVRLAVNNDHADQSLLLLAPTVGVRRCVRGLCRPGRRGEDVALPVFEPRLRDRQASRAHRDDPGLGELVGPGGLRSRPAPGAVRQGPAARQARPHRGLDQPVADGSAASLILDCWCLTGLDRFRPGRLRRHRGSPQPCPPTLGARSAQPGRVREEEAPARSPRRLIM